MTTFPDHSSAEAVARRLVDAGHAACVNVGAPVLSLYHWHGKTETATEIPVTIKSTVRSYKAVESMLLEMHPYELPEILAIPVATGLPAYLGWIAASANRSEKTHHEA